MFASIALIVWEIVKNFRYSSLRAFLQASLLKISKKLFLLELLMCILIISLALWSIESRFCKELFDILISQRNVTVNYTVRKTLWTCIIEYKRFEFGTDDNNLPKTVLSR